ncbi:putative leader peptide [Haloechinothrix salitolerans]|uniref:Leader peptide n=1 Tax=Haloechinothrix salitolerans TaxID=926830 RepID=A0ABW2BU94_9PSEU
MNQRHTDRLTLRLLTERRAVDLCRVRSALCLSLTS